AAYLYWAAAGDGQEGRFGTNAITGMPLGTNSTPCASLPTLTVYRADVLDLLPLTGTNRVANGDFVVQLPDSGQTNVSPSTLGASLVVVYQRPDLQFKADGETFVWPLSG